MILRITFLNQITKLARIFGIMLSGSSTGKNDVAPIDNELTFIIGVTKAPLSFKHIIDTKPREGRIDVLFDTNLYSVGYFGIAYYLRLGCH